MDDLMLIDPPTDAPTNAYTPSRVDQVACDVPAEFIELTTALPVPSVKNYCR